MESQLLKRKKTRAMRLKRVRKTLRGTKNKPRLSIFKSNRNLFLQVIDDESSKTLFSVGTYGKKNQSKKSMKSAEELGKTLAQEAKKKKIEHVIFDRGRYKYHGIIANLADAARKNGLQF